MLFNSFDFLIFFPLVTALYFLLPHKYRSFMLLCASCFFYMALIPAYILILTVTILIDYSAGILMGQKEDSPRTRRWILVGSVVSTCLVLFIFKYFNFFTGNITALAELLHWNYSIESLQIILPIGLSFHTFQSLSYVMEVYRKKQKPERNFIMYSLYVMFYPQLVAGPIERPQNLLPQFYKKHNFDYKRVKDGLLLIGWGMFKKVVIADRLAVMVDVVYNDPTGFQGLPLILATLFFTFQIYCDFSGYSDIAIGCAKVMGIDIMQNFRQPYFSKSISEFWSRWHISLSTWFRDYLYIPLGGNQVSNRRWYYNLAIVFLVSGLWHGANWTFVVWGGLHAFFLIASILIAKHITSKLKAESLLSVVMGSTALQLVLTFGLVAFAWIFFRANSIADALYISGNIFSGWASNWSDIIVNQDSARLSTLYLGVGFTEFLLTFVFIGVLLLVDFMSRKSSVPELINSKPTTVRWSVYYVTLLAIVFYGMYGETQQFIYFQF